MKHFERELVRGFLHEPEHPNGNGLVITHGAGANSETPLLKAIAEAFASAGVVTLRCDLPFRQQRPKGPPYPAQAERDREGLRRAVEAVREIAGQKVFLGGHSYGGRQTSMVVAEANPAQVDVLTLFSYPVHPPGKPERPRTEHLPDITVPTVFTHGTSDPFGTPAEVRDAAALIAAPIEVVEITGARHDLRSKTLDVSALAVDAALRLLR